MEQGDFIWYRGTLEDGKKVKGVFDFEFNTFNVESLYSFLEMQYPTIRFAQYSYNKVDWIKMDWLDNDFNLSDDCPECGGEVEDLDGVGVCNKCGIDLEWDEETELWVKQ